MKRNVIASRIADLVKEWRNIDINDLHYKENVKKYGEEEARRRFNALKNKFIKVRDALKDWELLKHLKTEIASYPWMMHYQFKDKDKDNLRFYFFKNPIEPKSESPKKSLQLNLEFWSDGTIYIFFRPWEFFATYYKDGGKAKHLEKALKETGYVSYVLQKDFIYYDGNRIDGSKRDQDTPDWNDWVGRAFNIETITEEDILNSFEDLKKAFDLYARAVQEVLNAQKFRGNS